MSDPLLENDPWVQELGERKGAEGYARGYVKGFAKNFAKVLMKGMVEELMKSFIEAQAESLRESIETVVQARFPVLYDLAMERVDQIEDPALLQRVLVTMSVASSKRKVRQFLRALPVEQESPLTNEASQEEFDD